MVLTPTAPAVLTHPLQTVPRVLPTTVSRRRVAAVPSSAGCVPAHRPAVGFEFRTPATSTTAVHTTVYTSR